MSAPKLLPFEVRIGQRGAPRLSFGCMAASSFDAAQQHLCLAERGERVEIVAVGQGESFPIRAERQALASAQVREICEGRQQ